MMARPIANYLVRFGPGEAAIEIPEEHVFIASAPAEEPEDPTDLVEEARARGYAEGYDAAKAEEAVRVAQEQLEFDEKLAAARQAWTTEEGDKLVERITAAGQQLEAEIAKCVDGILRPFLVETLRRQAVEELARDVAVLLADDKHAVISISGAEDLLAAVRSKLPASNAAIDYVPNESVDVCVVARQTIIETRIAAWLERLQAAAE
jgi:hypothetical protein